jgi:Uncharacterized alpha/beta hydrolase domain (DUF2235)
VAERRFFVLFDGSGQAAAAPSEVIPTNITRLNQCLTYGFEGTPQIFHYFSGVGTYGDGSGAVSGRGFDEIIINAYVNLASNFMDGDKIYIFGFSRGAAAALALCHFISDAGLLSADEIGHFPAAWNLFMNRDFNDARRSVAEKNMRQIVHLDASVSFLGLFDTVAGTAWDRLELFSKVRIPKTTLPECVEQCAHILAIDDERPSFEPIVLSGLADQPTTQKLTQIWMPGVHSDIGGSSDGLFLGGLSLLTMLEIFESWCPEVELDTSEIDSIVDELHDLRKIVITDEGWTRVLGKGQRSIRNGSYDLLHPLYVYLQDQTIFIKNVQRTYSPKNVPPGYPVVILNDKFVELGKLVRRVLQRQNAV